MLSPLDMHGYHGALPMPEDFIDWWIAEDFASTYACHRRTLTLLHSQRGPRRWLLKAPTHLFHLEAFAREYPDARFLWTHRDPASVIPSVSSLQHTLHTARCEAGFREKTNTGPHFLEFWAQGMDRALAARATIGEERFVDVWNDDVIARPVETITAACARLGLELCPDMEARIHAYNARNAKGVHGEHRYSAEEYGLSRKAIRERFHTYVERFGV